MASSAPLDQYIIEHPDYFFDRSPEHAHINPDNPEILVNHLKCAAFELPLRDGESFGRRPIGDLCRFLEELGVLHRAGGAWHWTSESYPADTVSLRAVTSDNFVVIDTTARDATQVKRRQIIAAVYYNRLKKKMPLQADPTAIYGVKSSSEKITRSDLLRKTPYNTYVIRGLPPGPIASPGIESIRAALNPADVPYLYFVSNNDGTHIFSVTLAEHAEAVKAYRDKKKAEAEAEG